jgi:hypothetical protein
MNLYEKQPLDILHGFFNFLNIWAEQCHLQIEGNSFSTKIVRQAWTSTVELRWAWLLGMQCWNIEIHMRDVSKASFSLENNFHSKWSHKDIFGFERAPSVGDFSHRDIFWTFQIRNLGLFLLPFPLGFPLKKITDDMLSVLTLGFSFLNPKPFKH